MKIVIIGAGQVGFRVAQSLAQDKHDIILIENNPEYATRAEENLDVIVVRGNGALPSVLARAGISAESENLPDMLISVTNQDEVNIMASLLARQLGVANILVRAVSLDFAEAEIGGQNWARALGLEMFVTPERVVAREIANLLEVKSALRVTELAGGRVMVQSFEITEESPVLGKTVLEIRRENPSLDMLVVTVKRGESSFVPTAGERLFAGDFVSVLCHKNDAKELAKLFQKQEGHVSNLKRVFIAGGGRVGTRLAMVLKGRHPKAEIKLVERNSELCKALSAELDGVMVLSGNANDANLLLSEGIAGADGFVATTEEDEKDLILAAHAHSLGAQKTIALVRNENYLGMPDVIPVDAVVDKNQALASLITRSVRYPNSKEIVNLISDSQTETMELKIAPGAFVSGKTFAELDMPKGSVVGLLVRGRELLIPFGSTEIKVGDELVLFGSKAVMPRVVELFTKKG